MKKVLVIGDIISDEYRECSFKKMCPDAANVPAFVECAVDLRPGGAANVAVNLASLSPQTKVYLIGSLTIPLAREVKRLSKNVVNMEYCDLDESLVKQRIIVAGEMLCRLDNMRSFSWYAAESICNRLKEFLAENDPDLVIFSDYGAGSLNEDSFQILLSMREKLLVDTKLTDLSPFGSEDKKTRLVKLNSEEWKSVVQTEAAPERFFSAMIVTTGKDGAILSIRNDNGNKSVTHTMKVNGCPANVADVCGCGDTFLAGVAASLLVNDDYFTAVQFANAAASTVVSKPRTAVADLGLTLKLIGRGDQNEASE